MPRARNRLGMSRRVKCDKVLFVWEFLRPKFLTAKPRECMLQFCSSVLGPTGLQKTSTTDYVLDYVVYRLDYTYRPV